MYVMFQSLWDLLNEMDSLISEVSNFKFKMHYIPAWNFEFE